MDKSEIIASYEQQIKALGYRYTFCNKMRQLFSHELFIRTAQSDAALFEIASSFCKFYAEETDIVNQLDKINRELEFVKKLDVDK